MNSKIEKIYHNLNANRISFEEAKSELGKIFAIDFLNREFEELFKEKPVNSTQTIMILIMLPEWLGLQYEFLTTFNRLLIQSWHTCHEILISEIASLKSSDSVAYIDKAIQLELDYLVQDESDTEYVSFIRKCMITLADINTSESIELINKYKNDKNEVVRRCADEQIRWLNGEKGMRYMP